MVGEMLIVTFILGVILALLGASAFITRLVRGGESEGGGVNIRLGKWLVLDTGRSSLAFTGLGLFLVLSGLSGAMKIRAQGVNLLEQEAMLGGQNHYIRTSAPVLAAVSRFPSAAELVGPTEATGLEGLEDSPPSIQERAIETLELLTPNEDLALTVLNSLSENTFGLTGIPAVNAEQFSGLLKAVTLRFPANVPLQIQAADLYRSLYESTKSEEYQEAWGQLAARSLDMGGLKKPEIFKARQLVALHLQSEGEYEDANARFAEAREVAPEKELHKLEYNVCNNHFRMRQYAEAKAHCELSVDLARRLGGAGFWPPTFVLALIEKRSGNYASASSLFIQSSDMARLDGEGADVENYLRPEGGMAEFCQERGFRERFTKLCD